MADFCTACCVNWLLADLSTCEEQFAELDPAHESYKWQVEILDYMKDFLATKSIGDLYETVNPDIDVWGIFNKLPLGHMSYGHICEGCGLTAIRKTESGHLKVAYMNFGCGGVDWKDLRDYRQLNCSLQDLVKAYQKNLSKNRS